MENDDLKLAWKSIGSNARSCGVIAAEALKTIMGECFSTNQPAWAVVWCDHEVCIGRWENGCLVFPSGEEFEPRYLQRLRLFDESSELHVWCANGSFKGRFRCDDDGSTGMDVVIARQLLYGTDTKKVEGGTRLFEERGMKLTFPIMGLKVNQKKRLFIETRNYIGYPGEWQATYIDCRFVAFTYADGQRISRGGE